jgi:hypothetical protein
MRSISPIFAALLAACGGEVAAPDGVQQSAAIKILDLSRANDGVSPGFNLDGIASDFLDERSCNHPDWIAPDGTPGIDNQFAVLLPLLDVLGEGAVNALLQTSIDEGRLLLIAELEDFGDGSARVVMRRGEDVPLRGSDGRILAGQTLGLSGEPNLGEAVAQVQGSTVMTEPFGLRIPVVVFSGLYVLDLVDARMQLELDADGVLTSGTLGGAATLEQIWQIAADASPRAGTDVRAIFGADIEAAADLAWAPEAGCTALSMAATFQFTPVFTFR